MHHTQQEAGQAPDDAARTTTTYERETGEEPAPPEDRAAMITLMNRYHEMKHQLAEGEENARVYLQVIQDEVKESLAPLRGEIERARRSMEVFLRERNGGRSFAVPALGTAYVQNRVVSKIVDPEKFLKTYERTNPEKAEALCDRKLNASRAKKEAERAYREDGEIVPGAEVEQASVVCFKPSAAAGGRAPRHKRPGA